MFLFNLIRLGGTYLTNGGGVNDTRYISEISGLDKLKLNQTSTAFVALDGTVIEQFTSLKGLSVSIRFDLLDTTTFDAIVTIIRASRTSGNAISLYIDGEAGIFDLDVRCIDMAFPATAQEAGLRNVQFNFIVTGIHNHLEIIAGQYSQTGRTVTLTYSGA